MNKEEYKTEVENKLMSTYGVGINDCTSEEEIFSAFENNETTKEFVEWIGEKYDLTKIKELERP